MFELMKRPTWKLCLTSVSLFISIISIVLHSSEDALPTQPKWNVATAADSKGGNCESVVAIACKGSTHGLSEISTSMSGCMDERLVRRGC